MAKKIHLNSPKNCIFSLKKGFEPQYFTLRTLEKYGNLSVKNVLKISPKLRLSFLINFVLIKKECYVNVMCLKDPLDLPDKNNNLYFSSPPLG